MQSRLDLAVARMASPFRVPRNNPELVQAKFSAIARQVPMMYALLLVNTTALAITFYGSAPTWLAVAMPLAFGMICALRAFAWSRPQHQTMSTEQTVQRLKLSIVMAGILGVGLSAWSVGLLPYGDAYARSHVAFFTAVTTISCVFCLMHLRAAALLIGFIVVIPFAVVFGFGDNVVLRLIALNFVLVIAVIAFVMLGNYGDFERRVNSEAALLLKQSELQLLSDTNFRNSNFDSLTGLPNRRHFFSELERNIATVSDFNGQINLGIIDLDGFKPINDVHGHRVGDRLLVEVARRLRAHFEAPVFLARLGGDEFGIFSHRLLTKEMIADAGKRLAELFEVPYEIDDATVRIGCSVGYAQYPLAAKNAQDLFDRADYALFFAKQHARGRAVCFSEEHEDSIREASLIDRALSGPNLEHEMWIAYQPIVDACSGQPGSLEALARWSHPTLGDVPPMKFIVAAERSGNISKLTALLLRKALQGAANWPDHVRISFNLSAVDVASPLSILKIINVVEQSGVRPGRIDFEITETAVMGNLAQASEALRALRALGCRISLDDFGTGYSSLSCIRELPLDRVKIDRSFISNIESDNAARLILRTMIGLCSALGHECVVEGVETAGQTAFLRSEACGFMQGYHFARPMPGDHVGAYLAAAYPPALIAARA